MDQLSLFDALSASATKKGTIEDTENGFILSRKDRNTVIVQLTDTCIEVSYKAGKVKDKLGFLATDYMPLLILLNNELHPIQDHDGDFETTRQYNLFDYYNLSRGIAEGLIQYWTTDIHKKGQDQWLVGWLVKKTAQIWGNFDRRFPENKRECQACGLSVFTNIEHAKRVRRRTKRLRSCVIGVGTLTPEMGVIKPTPSQRSGKSHCTWWVPTGLRPWTVFQIIKET